jgi:short-subunit dehydrogenase
MNWKGKTVWITGASSGIGRALATEFAKKGAHLLLSGRKTEALEAVKAECSKASAVDLLPFDLANYKDAEKWVAQALDRLGRVDLLINNAGISQRSLIADTSMVVVEKLMQVNYFGTVALTTALLPHWIERKTGKVATVTSLMGRFGSPYRSGYCGAKHALHGFFDVLRMEHEKDGLQVTLLAPGFVQTDIARNALVGDGQAQNSQDKATANGLTPARCAAQMRKAIEKKKFEAYFGKKEVMGIYLKRFFPRLLHKRVMGAQVR